MPPVRAIHHGTTGFYRMLLTVDRRLIQKTNCKADRTAKKGNNFIAQYFGETKLTFRRG